MVATIQIAGKKLDAEPGRTIETAVRDAGYLPDAYLFAIDGRPVPMDTPIEDGANIRAIKVASGG